MRNPPPGEPPAHQRRQAAQSVWLEGASSLGQCCSSTGHWEEISYPPKCPGTRPTLSLETPPWVSRSPAGKTGSILHHNSHLHLVFLLLDPLLPSLSLLSLHPPLHLAFAFLFFSSFSPSFPFFLGTPTHSLTYLHLPVPDSTEPLGALGQLRAQRYHRQWVNGSRVKNFLCYFPLMCLCEYLARSVTTEDWKCSCHGPLHGTF